MKNLTLATVLLFSGVAAHADLVASININKLSCTGQNSARTEADTPDGPIYAPAAPGELNYNFVKITVDNSTGKSSGTIEFLQSQSGPVVATASLDPDINVSAGTEGGPAYTQFSLSKGISAFLGDTGNTDEFEKALIKRGTSEVNLVGSIGIESLSGKKYSQGQMAYQLSCKMNLTVVPVRY